MSSTPLPSQPLPYTSITCIRSPGHPEWVHAFFQNMSHGLYRKTFKTGTTSGTTTSTSDHYVPLNAACFAHDAKDSDSPPPPKYYPLSTNAPLNATFRNYEESCYSITQDCYVSQEIPYQAKITRCATYSRVAASAKPVPEGEEATGLGWVYYQGEGEELLREIKVEGFKAPNGPGEKIKGTHEALEGTHLAAIADTPTTRMVIFQKDEGIYEAHYKDSKWSVKRIVENKASNPLLRLAVTMAGKIVCLYYCHNTDIYRICRTEDGKWDKNPKNVTPDKTLRKTAISAVPPVDSAKTVLLFYQSDHNNYEIKCTEDTIP